MYAHISRQLGSHTLKSTSTLQVHGPFGND